MNLAAVQAFIAQEFPQISIEIEQVGERKSRLRHPIRTEHLRPGGTVSGPTLMMLADVALYIAILGELGPVALAVTTNLNTNFFSRPRANADIIADCRLLKMGKRLVVGEVFLYSEGEDDPVAHAIGTYSIPPTRS